MIHIPWVSVQYQTFLKLPLRVALKFVFKMSGVLYMTQTSPTWMLLWPVINWAIVDMVNASPKFVATF